MLLNVVTWHGNIYFTHDNAVWKIDTNIILTGL